MCNGLHSSRPRISWETRQTSPMPTCCVLGPCARTAEHEVESENPFQVLLAYKPVLDLNLVLTSRDLSSSTLTLALP